MGWSDRLKKASLPETSDGPVSNGAAGHGSANGSVPVEIPSRWTFVGDLANICTLSGAACSMVSLIYVWQGRLFTGLLLNMLANTLDIVDGPIARSTKKRHPALGIVGAKLDTHADIVSHVVVPCSVLMVLSGLDPVCIAIALAWTASCIFRQAYFEVFRGLEGGACVFGVTSDYMSTATALTAHLLPVAGSGVATLGLCAVFVLVTYGAWTTALRSRAYRGRDLLYVIAYNVSLAISCLIVSLLQNGIATSFSLMTPPTPFAVGLLSFTSLSFIFHLLLAYPAYFRFIELNN